MAHQIKNLPRHVAIIMDGNGRWARERGLPRIEGHRRGAESVREIVRVSGELGIEYLTLYAFSIENWNRPKTEVSALMRLLEFYLKEEIAELNKSNVRLAAIGRVHDNSKNPSPR
jgi:undecaprenyl diphosphate synthase